MTWLARLSGGLAVVGIYLISYDFPVSGFVLALGGVVLMIGLIVRQKRSDRARTGSNDS